MPDITVTCEGIAKLFLNLNPNKANDPDDIKPRVVKELTTEIVVMSVKSSLELMLLLYMPDLK
jgi:hypothetical protein